MAREAAVDRDTNGMFAAVRETGAIIPNLHRGKNTQVMSAGAFHTARDPSARRLRRPVKVIRLVT